MSTFRLKNAINVQASLLDSEPVKYIERQVFEPGRPGEFEVTAHRAEVKICTCGCRNQAEFRKVLPLPHNWLSHTGYGRLS
ncbi:hypothetical protein [Endozoicomonas sp. SCSIO W0465]|uniref:hypothetical protein n=1 Tax=Endozoicomonas sp. SCSIO W0465 TaxID=2918516 RepID=UPI002076391F|nr:hypothetical protein [Endozoicomonas sp. SCSIO W0465]USE38191.1 hypothetical protein MJO57_08500 [Endozoicomonas sp. SCSIO W0465]